jgi:hypothetical protein
VTICPCRRSRFGAFGPAKVAIGLSDIDEHAAQLRAGIAIINAAIEGKIKLAGTPCERWHNQAHLLRQTGHRIAIGSETLQDLIPVLWESRLAWAAPLCRRICGNRARAAQREFLRSDG